MTLNKNAKDFVEKQGLSLAAFAPHPAANLLTVIMSPYYSLFAKLSSYQYEVKQTEVYYRSADHPINGRSQYIAGIPGYGMQAHLGLYKNSIEHIENLSGKTLMPKNIVPVTTVGDGQLHTRFLSYQQKALSHLMAMLTQHYTQIKPGVYNDYPCLMVHIKRPSLLEKGERGRPSHEAWVELWGSFFIGTIVNLALNLNIPIEMARRSSFGHLRPSLARTGESLRINLGMVPMMYSYLIPIALNSMDKVIDYVLTNPDRFNIGPELFVHQESYRQYISEPSRDIYASKNLVELLFRKAEKGNNGQKTIQALMRTAYARQTITGLYIEGMLKNNSMTEPKKYPVDLFMAAVHQTLAGFNVVGKTFTMQQGMVPKLELPAMGALEWKESLLDTFWVGYFDAICTRVKAAFKDNTRLMHVATELQSNIVKHELQNLYNNIEVLQELIYAESVTHDNNELQEDGYGSDSECEQAIGLAVTPARIFSKKIITHNGMRAIVASIVAIARHIQEANPTIKTNCYVKNAYYEVESALEQIGTRWGVNTGTTKQLAYANIVIYDMNGCVTSPSDQSATWSEVMTSQKAYYILDVTSSMPTQVASRVNEIFLKNTNIKAIFLVTSGLKIEQLGSDKNHYGLVRILSLDKNLRDKLYRQLKSPANEQPCASVVAHDYRRLHKKIGSSPRSIDYLKPSLA